MLGAANFRLWTVVFWDGISSVTNQNSYTALIRSSLPRLWEQGVVPEGEGNCCVGEDTGLRITTPYRGADKSLARPGRKKLERQKILSFMYPIYNNNWRNISTIYIYNKTSIKRNILTIKQNTSGRRSG